MPDLSFLSWPFFDAAHAELRAATARFAAERVAPLVDHHDVDGSCRRLVSALGDAGLTRHAVTAPYGGFAERLDVRSLCLIRETLAYASGLADFAFAMQGLGTGPLTLFGTHEQKRRWLPDVATGRAIAAFALSEQEAGFGCRGAGLRGRTRWPRLRSPERGEDLDLERRDRGSLCRVLPDRRGPRRQGLVGFRRRGGTLPGFDIVERLDTIAPHPLARLRFDGCRVPVSHRIGAPGEGFKIAMATLDVFRSTVGGGGARPGPAGLRRDARPRHPRGVSMAARWPTCRPSRVIWPTWRSTSTPPR